MTTKANRATHPLHTVKDKVQLITAHMTGDGAADLVNADADNLGGGEITIGDRQNTGEYDLTFKHSFPSGVPLKPMIVGTTAGLDARFTAWDPTTGTATVLFEVAAVATDPAATDDIYFAFLMRNSGLNT